MIKEERELRKHIRTCPETMYKGMGSCCIRHVTALVRAVREDCAKVAVEFVESENSKKYGWRSDEIAAAIRAKK